MLDETIIGDRYRLLHKLGAGGMGEVHEAEHTVTGRRVALKLLLADNYYDKKAATWTERFRREARAASSVETPHAVQVLDAGQDERTRRPFIAMELLKGRDLGVVLRGGPLPPLVAARVIGQACLGLRTAHDRGVLHRDLKPSNLFVVEDAEGKATVKLVDFGIAKITTDQKLTTLTRTGQLVGTPVYLSPEQARGVPGIDARADVFSLGAVLYKALCGATPHRLDTSLVDFILRLCTEPAPPLSARAPWSRRRSPPLHIVRFASNQMIVFSPQVSSSTLSVRSRVTLSCAALTSFRLWTDRWWRRRTPRRYRWTRNHWKSERRRAKRRTRNQEPAPRCSPSRSCS